MRQTSYPRRGARFFSAPALTGALVAALALALALALMLTLGARAALASASSLIPLQMTLPAPWGILKTLLLLTFFIHLVLVSALVGSVALAAFRAWAPGKGPAAPLRGEVAFIPALLALAVNFGVAPFLFAQVAYGSYIYSSAVLMAVWWLSIPLVVMLAYYALYIASEGQPAGGTGRRVFLTLVLLLFLYVAFLWTSHGSLATSPDSWAGWFAAPGGTLLNLGDPTLPARYLHLIPAFLALGWLFQALRAKRRLGPGAAGLSQAGRRRQEERLRQGLNCFFAASLVQAATGVWYLLVLPEEARALFLGRDLFAMFALLLALAGLGAALWAARAGRVRTCAALALSVVFIMVVIRDLAREAALAPFNAAMAQNGAAYQPEALAELLEIIPELARQPAELPLPIAQGQATAFAFFLLCAALGAAALVFLARFALKYLADGRNPAGASGSGPDEYMGEYAAGGFEQAAPGQSAAASADFAGASQGKGD